MGDCLNFRRCFPFSGDALLVLLFLVIIVVHYFSFVYVSLIYKRGGPKLNWVKILMKLPGCRCEGLLPHSLIVFLGVRWHRGNSFSVSSWRATTALGYGGLIKRGRDWIGGINDVWLGGSHGSFDWLGWWLFFNSNLWILDQPAFFQTSWDILAWHRFLRSINFDMCIVNDSIRRLRCYLN